MLLFLGGWTHGTATVNSSSLGLNLAGIEYYSSEQPFANTWLNSGWFTYNSSNVDTNEEGSLCLDSNGYVTSLTNILSGGTCTGTPTFTKLSVLIYRNLSSPYYPSGTYDVYYVPNSCNFTYGLDATIATQNMAAGHDTITVTPSAAGIMMTVTAMGSSGNNCRGVSVTRSALTTAYLAGCINNVGSACFDPNFITFLKPFRALRFMEWMFSNGYSGASDPQTTYSTRPIPTQAFYGIGGNATAQPVGAAVETMVSLCNTVNTDCWFSMPVNSTSAYWTSFATFVHDNLNSNLKAYVEYANETWNYSFPQATTIQNAGIALWGVGGVCPAAGTSYQCNRDYHGMQTALIAQAWKTAWGGDSARVIPVMSAQAANTFTMTYSLSCPEAVTGGQIVSACSSSAYGISAAAIAPYFLQDAGTSGSPCYPTSFLSDGTNGINSLFTAIETGGNMSGGSCEPSGNISLLAQSSAWETSYTAALPIGSVTELLMYEGGQQFTNGSYAAWSTAGLGIQTDSRMATALSNYYATWKTNGGHLAFFYNDITTYYTTGYFGAVQNLYDPSNPGWTDSVKYPALEAAAAIPCWWPGC